MKFMLRNTVMETHLQTNENPLKSVRYIRLSLPLVFRSFVPPFVYISMLFPINFYLTTLPLNLFQLTLPRLATPRRAAPLYAKA